MKTVSASALSRKMRSPAIKSLSNIWEYKRILYASSKAELMKRYSGSFLGSAWIFIYPFLFLSVYLFVYLAVFKVSYPQLNVLESIIYIFSGLLPYIVLNETIGTSTQVLKQNLHVVKNVMFPVDLIPVRVFCMAIVGQLIGIGVILLLGVMSGSLSGNLVFLPYAMLMQALFLVGCAYIISPLGLLFVDVAYIVPLLLNLFIFISPIGFMIANLPEELHFIVYLNPVYYYIEPFRYAVLDRSTISISVLLIGTAMSVGTFIVGSLFFYRFKDFISDYE